MTSRCRGASNAVVSPGSVIRFNHEHARRVRRPDGLGHLRHQQRWQHARIEAAGTGDDHVRAPHGLERAVHTPRRRRHDREAADPGAGRRHGRFAQYLATVEELGGERHLIGSGRHDAPTGPDHTSCELHGAGEVTGDLGEGGEHQIAERMTFQAVARLEPVPGTGRSAATDPRRGRRGNSGYRPAE